MSIFVLGSLNMDLVTRTERLPQPGETLTGSSFVTVPGGKGANQAVASARLGATTFMVGRVGADDFGQQLRIALQDQGVDTSSVLVDAQSSSGIAAIAVDDKAQNTIIVVPAANGRVNGEDVSRLAKRLSADDLLLLQLEIPLPTVLEAARLAKERGALVILDPAPAQPLPDELYPLVDILTPNETEASTLTGISLASIKDAKAAAQALKAKGAARVVIKLGERGVVTTDDKDVKHLPALKVIALDSVAAGDAFNGGLAEALGRQESFPKALQQALAVAAFAVTRTGAQAAMPSRKELEHFLVNI